MGDGMEKPDGVFMVDNVPHDWLFPKVDAVIHHGGAGTTAAGLKFGKPTMIVPFFGDQPFWSAMVAKAGAGAKEDLPLRMLDSDKFAKGIREGLEPDARKHAQEIAESIEKEGDGAENAVDSFHRSLPLEGDHSMRCGIFPDRVAVWKVKHTNMRLSALVADLLVQNKQMQWTDVELLKNREWRDFHGPGEPITGAAGAFLSSFQEAFHSIANISETTKQDMKRYEKQKRKRKGMSVEDAIVMPGRIAHATRGTSIEDAKKELNNMDEVVNLQGDAEPLQHALPLPKKNNDPNVERPSVLRNDTSSTINAPVVIMKDIGQGVFFSYRAIVRMPVKMYYAMVQGFRNAPRLYGDTTVRSPPRTITGFRSGVKTAGEEFVYGHYDGVAGLIRIPL